MTDTLTKIKSISLEQWLQYTIIMYALIIPLSRAAIVFFSAVIFILWLVQGGLKEKFALLKSNHLILAISGFVLFMLLSIVWSEHRLEGLDYTIKYWYFFVIAVMFTSLKKEYLEYVISAFLAGMLISEILSYGIFFEWWTLKHGSPEDPTPFMNHLQYSLFLAFTSLLLLNRIFSETDLRFKIFYILYFASATVNLFMNGGRTGQVAFIATLFLVGFLNIKSKLKALLSMFVLACAILYSGYLVSPNFKHRIDYAIKDATNIIQHQKYCASFGMRVAVWIVGAEIIQEHPLLGIGIADGIPKMREIINEKHPDMACARRLPNYHNDAIGAFVHMGIIGFVFYMLMFYKLATLNIQDKLFKKNALTFAVVYFISSQFEAMIHQQFSMALFALFVGLFLAQYRIENEHSSTRQ
jgi:O-antigen ligase